MWIQGKIIISEWDAIKEELFQAFESGELRPWNRRENRLLSEEEIRALAMDMPPPSRITIDLVGSKGVNRSPELIYGLQQAFYNTREAAKYFNFLGRSSEFSAPEANTRVEVEAIKIALLKMEGKGKSFREIANHLWPNEKYANDNNIHKRVQRGLKRAKEMFEKSIANFDL